jgi:hypothetical protein
LVVSLSIRMGAVLGILGPVPIQMAPGPAIFKPA